MSDDAEDYVTALNSIDWEASIEPFHQLAKETQNPIYAWLALDARFKSKLGYAATGDIGDDFVIPGWVAEYLVDVVTELLQLAAGIDPRRASPDSQEDAPKLGISKYRTPDEILQSPEWKQYIEATRLTPQDAMKLLPAVLGLTRNGGWNAFSAFKATTSKMQEANSYEAMREHGVPSKIALHAISSAIGVSDPSHLHRRLREGRKLVKRAKVGKSEG